MPLIDETLLLHLQLLKRYPEFILNKQGTDALRSELQKNFDCATKTATFYDNRKQLQAVILLGLSQPSRYGFENVHCHMYFNKIDSDVKKWIKQILDDWSPFIDDKFTLTLDPSYQNLLPHLIDRGLCIQSLLLHGFPENHSNY